MSDFVEEGDRIATFDNDGTLWSEQPLYFQFSFVLNNDGPGKPIGIARHIGQRPVIVAGNSDGDLEMLQWGKFNDLAPRDC